MAYRIEYDPAAEDHLAALTARDEAIVQASAETVVVTRRGRPVAAVVSVEGTDMETLSLATNPDFLAIIERSRARCPAGSGISTEDMRRRLEASRLERSAAS